jgi:hypothetical protein
VEKLKDVFKPIVAGPYDRLPNIIWRVGHFRVEKMGKKNVEYVPSGGVTGYLKKSIGIYYSLLKRTSFRTF